MSAGGSSFWPTPTAVDAWPKPDLRIEAGVISLAPPFAAERGTGRQFGIASAAINWTMLWLTLAACGWTPTMVSRSSLPVRVTFQHGPGSFASGLICNPLFRELMMGWPIGWTAVEGRVTGWSAWLRRSRGELSALLSTFQAEPG